MKTHLHVLRFALISTGLLLALQACGGGSPPVTPPVSAVIGAAGGTLTTSSGATVVIPSGALSADITIGIEQTSAGAPALPSGFATVGQMFAFTPHGQNFNVPVTITLPFNPALVPAGGTPELYKNNAQNQWEPVVGATFGSSSVSGSVTSFSFPVVVVPPLERFPPLRKWDFIQLNGADLTKEPIVPEPPDTNTQNGGFMFDIHQYSEGSALPPLFDSVEVDLPAKFAEEFPPDGRISSEVEGSESGKTYSAYTEAGGGTGGKGGSETRLQQDQKFIKRASDATLSVTVSSIVLIIKDENSGSFGILNRRVCRTRFILGAACDVLSADVLLAITAVTKKNRYFFNAFGGATLYGAAAQNTSKLFDFNTWSDLNSREGALWQEKDFVTTTNSKNHTVVHLASRRTFNVDLSTVNLDEEFTLSSLVVATAYDRSFGMVSEFDTYAAAYLRDPQKTGGMALTTNGLEAVTTTELVEPEVEAPVPPAPCVPGPGPDPAAGVIQFGAPSFTTLEGNPATLVTVTRTGGLKGAVTATVRTSDGSARAGTDYTAMNQSVFFGDGDDAERIVRVPLINNTAFNEPDKTLNITLSQPGGCVALGAQTSTVLTITDNDSPPPPPTFTVGGTVTGLTGTGLVLEDRANAFDLTPTGNGAFAFRVPLPAPKAYDVRVKTQPNNPIQTCSVTNGTGTISNANITNIAVNCVTPVVNGALDSSFGDGGKTFTAFGGDETALALQADGKVVMVGGGVTDFTLARYTTAGRLDSSFGGAGTGTVTTDIATGNDQARGVAIQSDGKIVVVGSAVVGRTANNASNFDFAVVRYNTDGTPDNSFSGDGKVTTDFNLLADTANGVAIQSDGKIVVVGSATLTNPGFADFAIARYNLDGTLDSSFDGDGKVTTAVGARVDLARNVVVLASGTILVSGFSEVNSRDGTGLARYTVNGALDTSFGGGSGKTSVPDHRLEEGLSVQSDGKIVIAGSVNVGVFPARSSHFGVMRFSENGLPDNGFGSAGLVTLVFTILNDFGRAIALQADGKIVVAGQSSNGSNPDFGVARFNSDGTPDGSFGTGGKLSFSFFNAMDGAEGVVVQPDGRIVVGGFVTSGTQFGYGLARVNP